MKIIWANQYKKDYKKMRLRGKDMGLLNRVVGELAQGEALAEKHCDHPLKGSLAKYRECHIEPNWLLLYKKSARALFLARTGTHADLFE